jgi:outer membrane biogenesis lipoprotein LolB
MKTKRFVLAISAAALLAGTVSAQACDHHRNHWRGNGYWQGHHQVVYQNFHHYGYYRPVAPIISVPLPIIVVRP